MPNDKSIAKKTEQQKATSTEPENSVDVMPPIPPDVFDKLPADVKSFVSLSMQMGMGRSNPIAAKVTPEHIGQMIGNAEKDSERDYNLAKSGRWFHLAYSILAIAFLAFIIWYLPTIDKELFKLVITAIVSLTGGFGGGYGYSRFKQQQKRKDED